MQHFLKGENIALMTCRQTAIDRWEHIGITKYIADDSRVSNRSKERGYILPLYLYPDANVPSGYDQPIQQSIGPSTERTPNLNMEIVNEIAQKLDLTFVLEKPTNSKQANPQAERSRSLAPIDILDYIYAVLHSPSYREKYKEFLKIDFPRVPYPEDRDVFWALVKWGGELRRIHLLESPVVDQFITQYPVDGDNVVGKPRFIHSPPMEGCPQEGVVGKVYINETQYFENVPETAWEMHIGGYQPAQKWLKDRKGRALEFDDILHYQKIIVALTETHRIMKEIDKIEMELSSCTQSVRPLQNGR